MSKHSQEFLRILASPEPKRAIRRVTHAYPIFVFWVTPEGSVVDAKNAHHKNPHEGDRSILSHPTHKGHLRGRSAFIGDRIYIVIYGDGKDGLLSKKQQCLLQKTHGEILNKIKTKLPDNKQANINSALFINEAGEDITPSLFPPH